MIGDGEELRDLAGLSVPAVGSLLGTGGHLEPYVLVDPVGAPVDAAAAFFRDLLAAGRSAATVRSYGMDLLRWFRFLWAAGVPWDRATRAEARDFCRWLQIGGMPGSARPGWRRRRRGAYAASVRAHSETVLRGFYDFHRDGGQRADHEPVPAGPRAAGGAGERAPQPDGALS